MDEFRLRVFVTAARTLSFSKCAAALNITQPAVSRHIGELEARYGMPLFVRGTSGVALTKAGGLLLQHAEGLLSAYQKMDYDMELLSQTSRGRLSIGASTTIAMYLLPPVLAAFMERSGGVEVSMLSGNSENVEQWLRDGTVDIGFVENASRRPWLHYEPLMADELVLVAGTQGRYGSLESVTPDELRGLPLAQQYGSHQGLRPQQRHPGHRLGHRPAPRARRRLPPHRGHRRRGHAPRVCHRRPPRRVLRAQRTLSSLHPPRD